MKNVSAFILSSFLILCSPYALASNLPADDNVQLSIEQMLSIAEKQHEIAKLLIKEGRFERVLPEMQVIFNLNLQGEYEQAVAKSAGYIAYLLAVNKQYALGHELLDEAVSRMRQPANGASLLKIKAYIYKSQGNLGKAIETLERSNELERQQMQP